MVKSRYLLCRMLDICKVVFSVCIKSAFKSGTKTTKDIIDKVLKCGSIDRAKSCDIIYSITETAKENYQKSARIIQKQLSQKSGCRKCQAKNGSVLMVYCIHICSVSS